MGVRLAAARLSAVAAIIGAAGGLAVTGAEVAAADGGRVAKTPPPAGKTLPLVGTTLPLPLAGKTLPLPLEGMTLPLVAKKLPLAGKIVGIDPGHNGRNYTDPDFINHLIWNGRENETCDTTGTETDSGYTEAQFNWNVASDLTADLEAEGARVVLTRHSNDGVGPCVTTRAQIIDSAHADVAVDIHADGGPPDGRGFAILEPVADGTNSHVISSSDRFATLLRSRFLSVTGMPESSYDGVDGLEPRDDLAGLNLTTVPKVLIECGNMRDATDAGLLVTSAFQEKAARAMAEAITQFLSSR